MAKYWMEEVNDLNGTGKRITYPRIEIEHETTLDELADEAQARSSLTRGDFKSAITILADLITDKMGLGHSVRVDGMGTFTPLLSVRKDFEPEEIGGTTKRNAQSIEVKSIGFRPDRSWVKTANLRLRPSRSTRKSRRSSSTLTLQERIKAAQDFVNKNPCMTVRQYMDLTGLLHTTAAKELGQIVKDTTNGIASEGRGTHRLYVKAPEDSNRDEIGSKPE